MAAPIKKKCQKVFNSVHNDLENPGEDVCLVAGEYYYFHYGWDGLDDRGWGCGYRTLQSLCSWVKLQKEPDARVPSLPPSVPSIPEIQEALVAMEDKPVRFRGSKDWIGSFEVCLCLDYFYDVPCKILHVNAGKELPSHFDELVKHFSDFGSPIMMGGDSDNSSKGILGVCTKPQALLVMDPHYYGQSESVSFLQKEGWIKWRRLEDFHEHSFYNLCLPQLKNKPVR